MAVILTAVSASTTAAPNVLFFAVDDLGAYLNSYGHGTHTPNFDRLKAMGTQFNRAYVSVSVCAPSRTAFLTGLRPDTSRVWTIGPYFRNHTGMDGVKTLPQLFRDAGYNATGAGKIFHIGTPSGGMISSEGGGDQCPQFPDGRCNVDKAPKVASWTEPYWFCDQFMNDTVQNPMMQGPRDSAEHFSRLKVQRCTARGRILIPAYCFALL